MRLIPKPNADEYAPYARRYIDLLPDDGRVLEQLQTNWQHLVALVKDLPESRLITPCAAGEWTIKEILVHLMDAERITATRALRFARHDPTPLPGFEPDDYTPHSRANDRTLEDIFAEYQAVRQATIHFFKNLDEVALLRVGLASGNQISVRAILYQIAGHELHHLNSIRENYCSP